MRLERPVHGMCYLLLSAGFTIAPMFAQANAATEAPRVSNNSMSAMPLVAPLFIEDERRTSVITMINSGPDGVDVDVVLYGLPGDQLAMQTVSISPHSQKTIAVGDLLRNDPAVQYGSVFLMPHRNTTMAAQLSITGRNGDSTNDIEEEFQMLMGSRPANFRAVSASTSTVVAIRSLSSERQTLSVTCLKGDHDGQPTNGNISIGPNETLLIDACANGGPSASLGLPKIQTIPLNSRKGVAVSVSSPVASMDLAVFGLGVAGNELGSGFVAIPFTDTNELKSSTAVFPGATSIAVNSTKFQAAVANFGAAPHQATIVLNEGSGSTTTQKTVGEGRAGAAHCFAGGSWGCAKRTAGQCLVRCKDGRSAGRSRERHSGHGVEGRPAGRYYASLEG